MKNYYSNKVDTTRVGILDKTGLLVCISAFSSIGLWALPNLEKKSYARTNAFNFVTKYNESRVRSFETYLDEIIYERPLFFLTTALFAVAYRENFLVPRAGKVDPKYNESDKTFLARLRLNNEHFSVELAGRSLTILNTLLQCCRIRSYYCNVDGPRAVLP